MILNEVCFIEILASTIIICLDEYYCMMVKNDVYKLQVKNDYVVSIKFIGMEIQ